MKAFCASTSDRRSGFALILILVLTGLALLLATGIFQYTSTNSTLNHRNNEYHKAVAAAEAATEKVVAAVTADFRDQGNGYVLVHLDTYRAMVPNSAENAACGDYYFQDLSRVNGRVEVTYIPGTSFTVTSGQYKGLQGINNKLRVLSNAKLRNGVVCPVGAVYQDIELIRIPLYQFAIFYNVNLEFDNQPVMTVGGRVHCNTNIYVDPYNTLTFNGDVTASGTIYPNKVAGNPLSAGSGAVVYNGAHDSRVSSLNLPIGTNASPSAVHAVLEVPSPTEDPASLMGQERLYNKADLIILIDNFGITAKSGLRNFFGTTLSNNEILTFLSTNVTFYNKRELKNIQTTQIDVAALRMWSATNTSLRPLLPSGDVATLYVADQRSLASAETGIRLVNGQVLPSQGLTVATPNPLYIQGDYNVPTVQLVTNSVVIQALPATAALAAVAAHTLTTIVTNIYVPRPASVAADAVTILSTAWNDVNGNQSLSHRMAANTTVNSAILSGLVPTTSASYSGGVENFPRFLEDWTNRTLTYSGSMVAMFYSTMATNLWRGVGGSYDIYNPPIRNWSWNTNYLSESLLPPSTPSVTVLVRGSWRMPAPYTTNVLAGM